MKKFFKMLFMLLFATMTMVSFSSCDGHDDDDDDDVATFDPVGTWDCLLDSRDYVVFKKGGTGVAYMHDDIDQYYEDPFNWSYDSSTNKLRISSYIDGETQVFYMLVVNNNEIVSEDWSGDRYRRRK